jgi:hypothetical protein
MALAESLEPLGDGRARAVREDASTPDREWAKAQRRTRDDLEAMRLEKGDEVRLAIRVEGSRRGLPRSPSHTCEDRPGRITRRCEEGKAHRVGEDSQVFLVAHGED